MLSNVRLEAEVYPVVSHAMAHNRISPIKRVTLHNDGVLRTGVEVTVTLRDAQGILSQPHVEHVDLDNGASTTLRDLPFQLDAGAMNQVEETRPGTIELRAMHANEVIATQTIPVTVLAARQWLWQPPGLALELLGAYVMPNAPEVADLLGSASDHLRETTGSEKLDGYQAGPDRVDDLAASIFTAFSRWNVRYSEPPANWSDVGQRVRTPGDLRETRLGTCLDTSLVFAAALEQAGIRPLVWILQGHTFVGWWRYEVDSWGSVTTDAAELTNRLELGHIGLVETTFVTQDGRDFAEARASAEGHLRRDPGSVIGVLDVWAARRSQIYPLPAVTRSASGESTTVVYQPAHHSVSPTEQATRQREASRAVTADGKPVPARVQRWKNSLLDLSLRNRLINFTDRAAIRLHVPDTHLGALEDLVNSGRQVQLTASDAYDEVYRHRDGIQRAADLPSTVLAEALTGKASVYTDLSSDSYLTRLRSLAYKARTVEEETGANNLYLALGTLVWELEGKELRSPMILVPVHLKAGARRATNYRVVLDESGTSTPNYCLLEKLRLSFGLTLPTLANPPLDDQGIALDEVFRGVRETLIARGHSFRVEATATLGLLQFAKFRLWKDLEENWERLISTPLARHLAHTPTEEFRDPAASSAAPDLEALGVLCPIPADGSQLAAIADAMAGRTFVLEGPPGTGKSQTIANLLARGIAEGKRILFVAEKRAALDVVARRVNKVGLGAFTLDLHDRDSRPAGVRRQIADALDLVVPTDDQGLQVSTGHVRAAAGALNSYAAGLHEPNAAGLSMYSAETGRRALGHGPTLVIPSHAVAPGQESAIETVRNLVVELPSVADPARTGTVEPWSFAQVDTTKVDLEGLGRAGRAVDRAASRLNGIGPVAEVANAARTSADLRLLADLMDGGKPPVSLLDEVREARWHEAVRGAEAQLAAARTRADAELSPAQPSAMDAPLSDIHARAVAAAATSWFGRRKRVLNVLEELRPSLGPGVTLPHKEVPAFLARLLELQEQLRAATDALRAVPGVSLPQHWNPLHPSEEDRAHRQTTWLASAAGHVAPKDDPFITTLRRFLEHPAVPTDEERSAVRELAEGMAFIQNTLGASDEHLRVWSGEAGLLPRWRETAGVRDVEDPMLGSLTRWLALREHLAPLRGLGFEAAHLQLLHGRVPAYEAALALDRGLAEASLTERRRKQGLGSFNEETHNLTVNRFCDYSDRVRKGLKDSLAASAMAHRTFSGQATSGQVGELRRELGRQRGGLSVRDLVGRYGRLITEIMPCVLVSPDSLARFFPIGAVDFDMVIFDEASQIRVADAIGAIGRARSVVVVGDSKQMPPTSVAEISVPLDDDDSEAEVAVEDEESILSECVQARVHRRWLTWHYRSQDESLIAFSNSRYYGGKLSSFPAPNRGVADAGINGHGINRVRIDGTFLRAGKGKALRTNPEEAAAILAEIKRRFDAAPAGEMPSIGVVTFNLQQRALIESMIRDSEDPRLIAALDSTAGEGLFVKNLENVQGDERDAILFSTAFSVNERGVLPLNFGPLNLAGGERRLNVAITRARRQVVLYSSFEPGQLRAEETSSQGIKHLREYLDVAAGGEDVLETSAGRRLLQDRHRDHLAERLRERGVVVRTDVGLSDFRIDLQLAKQEAPEEPVVAVLLDGPGWAKRMTVNDRDGMPRQVLDGLLGWPVVERVWLPSWLDNPDRVLDRLVRSVAGAVARGAHQETTRIPSPEETEAAPAASAPARDARPSATPYTSPAPALLGAGPLRSAPAPAPATGDSTMPRFRPWNPGARGDVTVLDALPYDFSAISRVRSLLEAGIEQEGPIHKDRLAKRVANAFGLARVAPGRIDTILETAKGKPDRDGFFWPKGVDPKGYEEFRTDSTKDRMLEHISPRELGNAMRELARMSGGITRDELRKETATLFGFKRLTAGMSSVLDRAVDSALKTGRLQRDGEFLRPGS